MYIRQETKKTIFHTIIIVTILLIALAIFFGIQATKTPDAEKNGKIITMDIDNTKFKDSIYGFDGTDIIKEIQEKDIYPLPAGQTFNRFKTSKHFEIYYNNSYRDNNYISEDILKGLEEEREKLQQFFKMAEEDIPIIKIYLFNNYTDLGQNLVATMKDRADFGRGFVNINSIYLTNRDDGKNGLLECVMANYATDHPIPKWLIQGTLSYLSGQEDRSILQYTNFSRQESFDAIVLDEKYQYMDRYAVSVVDTIANKYGEESLRKTILAYGDYLKALDITSEEFSKSWKNYVSSKVPSSAYVTDDTDYKGIIEKDGFFVDDAGFKYDSFVETDHVQIFFFNQYNYRDLMKEASQILEDEYQHALDSFDLREADLPKIKVMLCLSKYELYYSAGQSILPIDHTIGFAAAANKLYFVRTDESKYVKWEPTIKEMLIHNAYLTKMNKLYPDYFSNEGWLVEGLSVYYSNSADPYSAYYEEILTKGLPLSADGKGLFFSDYNDTYIYGYTLIEYILSLGKEDAIQELMKNPQDLEAVLGMSMDDFSDGWKQFVSSKVS